MKYKYVFFLLFFLGYLNLIEGQVQVGTDFDGEFMADQFGRAVSMPDPFTIGIGGYLNDNSGPNNGHVRIFRWDGCNWVQKGNAIEGGDDIQGAGDGFGWSISMPDSNTISIGARQNIGNGTLGSPSGHVRVFIWDGTNWVQKGSDIDGIGPDDEFGHSVSMPDINTLAIGAFRGGSGTTGYVKIYKWNGIGWNQKGSTLVAEAANDEFGYSLSMPDSNTVAVGATENDGFAVSAGHVRVFIYNGTNWVQKGLDIDGTSFAERSGHSVSMPDSSTIAIGSRFYDGSRGQVRIYKWFNNSWIQKGSAIFGETPTSFFGTSLSMIDSNHIAIGGDRYLNNTGQVRIFKWINNSWSQKGLTIIGENLGDFFGWSVSMPDTNYLAVGGYGNDANGFSSGHARVFTFDSIDQFSCIKTLNLGLDSNCQAIIEPDYMLTESNKLHIYNLKIDIEGVIVNNNILNESHIGKLIKVSVYHPCSGNSCWGYINIEDKLGPKLVAPKDTCVYCVESTLPTRTGQATATDCGSTPKVEYRDVVVDFACKKDGDTIQIITRTWTAIDDKGNRTDSVQKIYVKALSSDSIKAPVALVTLTCTDAYTPEAIASNIGVRYGYPHYISPVTGLPVAITRGSSCHFAADYVDKPILEEVCKANCKSTQKILRTWTVLNWCTGKAEKYLQVIKLEDKIAPTIRVTSPSEIYSVNAWGCDVDITMPTATVRDACDEDATVVSIQGPVGVSVVKRGNTWVALNVPSGTHTFTYFASDCCGNESTATITVKVVDRVAPVATAKEFITVSLVRSGADDILGVAKLFVDQVDNGSYDNCTKVYREIRREDDAPACLNAGDLWDHDNNPSTPRIPSWNNNRTYNNDGHLQDNPSDTDGGQFVKFCCEDIGKEVKVWLRVWDDANGSGIYGDVVDGLSDNYNETWSIVKVEDKTVPRITCKPDVTINCARDTGAVTEYNFSRTWISTVGKVPAGMLPGVEGACGVYEFEFRDAGSLNTCNQGTFTREYRVKAHPSVTCTQEIVVEDTKSTPQLEWPIVLHTWNKCTLTEEDVINNTVRARLNMKREQHNVGCTDDSYPITYCSAGQFTDLCKEGTGGAVQWNEDPALPYNVIPSNIATCSSIYGGRPGPVSSLISNPMTPGVQPRFNSDYKDPGCNVYGKKLTIEEYTVGEGCRKWLVRWDYINWCCNEKSACRETIYKYEDTTAPEITSCPGGDKDIIDATCAVSVVLNPTARDTGGCEAGLTWRVRIYPNDKTATGRDYVEIINTVYTLNTTATGGSAGSTTRIVGSSPSLTLNNIPAGEHGVRYLVTDGCGNVSECTSVIGVWPKAATPYCVSLSSAVTKNGLVELWARDFDRGSFTNCGSGVMYFTFNRGGVAEHPAQAQLDRQHYFTGFGTFLAFKTDAGNSTGEAAARALYNEGKAQLWLPDVTVRPRPTLPNGTAQDPERIVTGGTSGMNFGCKAGNAIGVPITVEMRVWDRGSFKEGTTQGSDFCSTRLTLIDNQGGCGPNTLVTLGGTVQTESVEMMNAVEVSLKAELPEYPQATKTDKEGKYEFNSLPIGVDYTIEAKKGDDYINGVNTLDLVQIQRHILGIKKLDNPYKLIAADADGDKAIRVNDIVTLRKMILGITDKIEEMPSWRFVDASDRMENGPWPFREVISHGVLTETTTKNNFIGVKIGDVDGTASANAVSKSTQPRSTGVRLSVEDRAMKAGEEVEISLTAEQFNEVHGMQLNIRMSGLQLLKVEGRAIDIDNENVATNPDVNPSLTPGFNPTISRANPNTFTLSWASTQSTTVPKGDAVMNITFKATKSGKLSDMLTLSNNVLTTEAYIGTDMERSGIVLEIGRDARPSIFNVSQNEPNPWKASTVINYTLPQAGAVKLTILDVTGKVIRMYDDKGEAGQNQITITREQLNGAVGVLIYKVESGAFSAQRKMVVIE